MKKAIAIVIMLISPCWAGRSFNGSTDIITANGIGSALDIGSGPETVSFWWYPTVINTTDQIAVAHYDVNKSGSQFLVGLGIGFSPTQSTIGWGVGCCGQLTGTSYGYCPNTINANHWYQIVMYIDTAGVFHGSAVSGMILVGNGINCSEFSALTGADRTSGQSNFTIGAEAGTTPLNAAGIVAEVAVWNVLLSLNEMTALQKVCPSSIRRTSLVGYFPLYGAASPEPDLSGHGNNGTVAGTQKANHPSCKP